VSEVAVPGRASGVVLSPQLTDMDAMVPPGAVAEKFTVTIWPVLAGFGEILETVTTGPVVANLTPVSGCSSHDEYP